MNNNAKSLNGNICPFILNGECDVPPCNSCYIDKCETYIALHGTDIWNGQKTIDIKN